MKPAIKTVLFIILLNFIPFSLSAGSISASGSWSETINASDLTAGAGSDLSSTYTSPPDQAMIDITATLDCADAWKVNVKKSDTSWHADAHLYIRRSSDGTTSGGTGCTITGGSSYLEVTDVDQEFFSGSGDRSSAGIQFQITGISIRIPQASYSTTIILTIVDI